MPIFPKEHTSIITEKIAKTKTVVEVEPESQVVIHCTFKSSIQFDSFVRIWQSTFLYDNQSSHISELVHVEKISMMPVWTKVTAGSKHNFTLIFTGLPKSCLSFDLIEKIPQAGGFEVKKIKRTTTDVYQAEIK